MSVEDKAEDRLASVIIGINRAGAGTLNTALHPVETGKAILQALRHPKQSAKSMAAQIKSDWEEDPTRTLVENLFPMPSPGSKLRKIVVPEKLALPHELDALRRAQQSDKRYPLDRVDRAEGYQKDYEGWYPGEDGVFRKDIGEVDVNPAAFNARGKSEFELADILRHPDLMQRLLQTGRPLPKFIRNPKGDRSGAYWDGKIMGQVWGDGKPTVKVGEQTYESFRDLFNHEVQHAAQDYGDLVDPYRGAGHAEGLERYWANPGEVEARVAALRSEMTPAERKKVSFPAMVELEREITRGKLKAGAKSGDYVGGTRWQHSTKLIPEGELSEIEEQILKNTKFGDVVPFKKKQYVSYLPGKLREKRSSVIPFEQFGPDALAFHLTNPFEDVAFDAKKKDIFRANAVLNDKKTAQAKRISDALRNKQEEAQRLLDEGRVDPNLLRNVIVTAGDRREKVQNALAERLFEMEERLLRPED